MQIDPCLTDQVGVRFHGSLQRFIGIDAGAETLKVVELRRDGGELRLVRREFVEHGKSPAPALQRLLRDWDWEEVAGAAVCGRFASQIKLAQIPVKQAGLRGHRFLYGDDPATIVNIGCHGFSVLEIRPNGPAVFRENGRCSQGTGNFLRQLVERFSLTVEEASLACADVPDPAPLSGRCPVILKTDMTHLANKGESRSRILAGLFDAVCENVMVLIKPGAAPARVLLTGGVSRSPRVRRVMGELLTRQGMQLAEGGSEESLYLDAVGCAVMAAESRPGSLPKLTELVRPPRKLQLEQLPSLADSLSHVRRMQRPQSAEVNGETRHVVLGFDIGSTGSKLVALDDQHLVLWEGYRQTLGNPVGAAQELLRRFIEDQTAQCPVVAFGATGSGREIVGSLLTSCYGKAAVFVVNEIVAHATGALHYDNRVDTIFEIGGQDAKYIRLAEGRITDCAMNEACSAGTGSFIEEQGRKFSGITEVAQLGRAALAAGTGVSLGQHCSVFMAEVIDEAVAAGVEQSAIISGLYDSIIKNYLNRVKGSRPVGRVIFCQGMPFSSDALAAAVARQTGSQVVVPPNPGTVGALGIALLAARELRADSLAVLDPARFLGAHVEQKDTFVCRSNCGCGGAGNRCRIERLRTVSGGERSAFTWGGGCSLHDKGTRKRKLPDLAPDPFREREEMQKRLAAARTASRGRPRIAISDEFVLKGLFPFFATFLHEAGFDLEIVDGGNVSTLKAGIQSAAAPFCAPMQLFHGVTERMIATGADWLFLPRIRTVPRAEGQLCSIVCPIAQAGPDLLRWTAGRSAGGTNAPRLLSPLIECSEGNLESDKFLGSCEQLGTILGLKSGQWRRAWRRGLAAQAEFDAGCRQIGRLALEFCASHSLVPVIVLGRNYTIYNTILNSNVPAILREQGAIGIPADCYPVDRDVPLFPDMYWGYGQQILRVAHQVRRQPGVYSLYCSNYSCGPDSFNLHFVAFIMAGKPFAIIETDGHSGDAGTKTRVEAFLHCVHEDRAVTRANPAPNDFSAIQQQPFSWSVLRNRDHANVTVLVPYIGPLTDAAVAVLRGLGLQIESLPPPDPEALQLGRRYTSGKECLPMPLTLGTLLQRLNRAKKGERFIYFLTSTDGPCRFGVYNLLNRIVLDQLGWRDRLRIWSPKDSGYFDGAPVGTEMLLFAALVASDLLLQARLDVRPVERVRGETDRLYEVYRRELLSLLGAAARGNLSLAPSLWQVTSGGLFGVTDLLRRAGGDFARLRGTAELPVVELTGEIYLRAVEFSNDSLIEKLEERGLRVHLSSKTEWVNYCAHCRKQRPGRSRTLDAFSDLLQRRIQTAAWSAMAPHLRWTAAPTSRQSLDAAAPFVNDALEGEAVLTLGTSLWEWRHRHIDGVVSVGPQECMPTKIAEAQFQHMAERDGLLSLTLSFNGEPINSAVLDNFAFEVRSRFEAQRKQGKQGPVVQPRAAALSR